MRGSVRIFRRDFLKLVRVLAVWIVIIGMAFVPALYAWFNIIGFWDPYSQTSHVRAAAANEDEGATKDQIGTVNVGAMLETQLKQNDQPGWCLVSADEARVEVEHGDSYAAFIIPASFLRDLAGIVDDTYVKPNIQYYVNEKNNAVASKITGAGAMALDCQTSSALVSTMAKVLSEKVSKAGVSIVNDADQKRSEASTSVSEASAKLRSTSQTLDGMGEKIDVVKALVASAHTTLSDLNVAILEMSTSLDQADQLASDSHTPLGSFSSQTGGALDGLSSNAASAPAGVSANAGILDGAVQGASGRVGGLPTEGASINDSVGDVLAELNVLGTGNLPATGTALTDLTNQNTALSTALGSLMTLSSDLSATSTSISNALMSASDTFTAVSASVTNARSGVSARLPTIFSTFDDFSNASSSMRGSLDTLRSQREQVSGLFGQLDSLLDGARVAIQTSSTSVATIRTDLDPAATDISSLSSSNTLRDLADSLGVNAESIASFMASPTQIEMKAVYSVAAYGSTMAPLFTNLALWTGALSLILLLKLDVDEEDIGPTSSAVKYMGRWMLLAFLGVVQGLVMPIGGPIIGVQTVSRPAFVGMAMIISLVFVSIVYMLSTCFQHVGKGLCVIIMIMQIPGSAGLYPIEMLPSFFRFLHPPFPFTYGTNALYETVTGFYGHTYLLCLVVLGVEALAAFTIGLALRPLLVSLNVMTTRDLAPSGLFLAKATRAPSSRYRLSQIVVALADHNGFQRSVSGRAARFEHRYPTTRRAAIILGVIVPVALAVLSVVDVAEVPIILGAWIVWALLVITFLIGLEYLREALARQQLLGAMDEQGVRSPLICRVQGAHSRIALGTAAVGTSISSALASSLGERGGENTDEAAPGLVDEGGAGEASEAAKGSEQ